MAGIKETYTETVTDNGATRRAYEMGKRDQRATDKWKARKAFCQTECGEYRMCAMDPVEGYGSLGVNCDKLDKFCEALDKEYDTKA